MSLPKQDLPLQLPQWAHKVFKTKSDRAKRMGSSLSIKNICEAILCREAAREADEARYLAAELDANGVDPKDYERYRLHGTDSQFGQNEA